METAIVIQSSLAKLNIMSEILKRITVRMPDAIIEALDNRCQAIFIKRDKLIASVVSTELNYLEKALDGKRQSLAAKKYISRTWLQSNVSNLNLFVEKSTRDRLKRICDDTNLVRDAFIGRVLFYLLAHDNAINMALSGNKPYPFNYDQPIAPLRAIEHILTDPFAGLHVVFNERGESLYLSSHPPTYRINNLPPWDAFACYLDDCDVPGTKDNDYLKNLTPKELGF